MGDWLVGAFLAWPVTIAAVYIWQRFKIGDSSLVRWLSRKASDEPVKEEGTSLVKVESPPPSPSSRRSPPITLPHPEPSTSPYPDLPLAETLSNKEAFAKAQFVYYATAPVNFLPKTVVQAELRNLGGLFLISVQRHDNTFHAAVGPSFVLHASDILGFVGTTSNFVAFCMSKQLVPLSHDLHDETTGRPVTVSLSDDALFSQTVQAIVRSKSWLVGKTPKQAGFRERYGASIISIYRVGEEFTALQLGLVALQPGDFLCLVKSDTFNWSSPTTRKDLKAPSLLQRL